MVIVAIISSVFVVMLCLIGILCVTRSNLHGESICDTVSRICTRISHYSGIIFLILLLVVCNYGKIKDMVSAVLPDQSVKSLRLLITLVFSSSAMSALQSALIYLLFVSCLSGLCAFFAVKLKTFIANKSKCLSGKTNEKNYVWHEYGHVTVKPCLIYNKYNS